MINQTTSTGKIRFYHSSVYLLGKPKRASNQNSELNSAESVSNLPDLKGLELDMNKRVENFKTELSKMRGNQVDTEMFNHLVVNVDNEKFAIPDLCQISLKSSSQIRLSVYDPNMVQKVSNSIRDSGYGLNPTIEGNVVLALIPKPSKESRDALIKVAQKTAEKFRTDVRSLRKQTMDSIKKIKSNLSEDDVRKRTKEVDALTEKIMAKIGTLLKTKETEIER